MAMADSIDFFAAEMMLAYNKCSEEDFSLLIELYQQEKETDKYIIDDIYNYIIKIDAFDRNKVESLLDYFLSEYPGRKKEIQKNRIHLHLNFTLEDISGEIAAYKKEFGEDVDVLSLELAHIMRGTVKIDELAQIMGKLKELKGEA